MALPEELLNILKQNGGLITTAAANASGFSNERLRLLTAAGELERAAHGVYIAPDELLDRMYVVQLRRRKIIFSHETALFLHDLTDRDPIRYSVTVPTGYNAVRLRKDNLKVYTIKKELYEVGVTQMKTLFGNAVRTYSLERTICDCMRSRNKLDIDLVSDALKRYARRSDKNLNALMEMAELFSVSKQLRSYMEVLL